jgi:hypothetical protein
MDNPFNDIGVLGKVICSGVLLVISLSLFFILIIMVEGFLPSCKGEAARSEFNIGNEMLGASGTVRCIKRMKKVRR